MKIAAIFFSFLIPLSVINRKQIESSFKVYKIDSIKSFYLIYAEKDNLKYKVVSQKQNDNDCKNIKIGNFYDFDLHSMNEVNGKLITPAASIYEVSGIAVDKTTVINFERETQWDLYYSESIKGLCFAKKTAK